MAVFDCGNPTEQKMLVDLQIYDHNNGLLVANWNQINISVKNTTQRIDLESKHFSTTNNRITDLKIKRNSFSFILNIPATYYKGPKKIAISGKKNKGTQGYTVTGKVINKNMILNKDRKITWKMTHEPIVLPYREIY